MCLYTYICMYKHTQTHLFIYLLISKCVGQDFNISCLKSKDRLMTVNSRPVCSI